MKKIIFIAILISAITMNAQDTVSRENLELRNNLLYEKETNIPFSGKSTTYHPNGQVASFTYISKGLKTGKIEILYDSGKIRVITFEDENFVNYGDTQIWNESGSIAFDGKWISGKLYKKGEDSTFTGKICVHYSNGKTNEESEFKDGKWNGKQIIWNRDGKITSECLFENNKIVDCKKN
jgi:antitoxin component YwqK of YwqJK toxin-antitoxin module